MSFPLFTHYQSDKHLYEQNCEELGADFFDEFLTYSQNDEEESDSSQLQESTSVKSAKSETFSMSESSSASNFATKDTVGLGIRRGDLSQQRSVHEIQLYSELSGRAAISDSELLSLEGIKLDSPQIDTYSCRSLPLSPSPSEGTSRRKKRGIAKALSKRVRKVANNIEEGVSTPIKKSDSPSKTSTSKFWGEQFDMSKPAFDFEKPILPLSPPPSSKFPSVTPRGITAQTTQFSSHDGLPHFSHPAFKTPTYTPGLIPEDFEKIHSSHPTPDTGRFPLTPQTPKMECDLNRWSHLPPSAHIKYELATMYTPPDSQAPLWWNHASMAPMAQPFPTALLTNPQRASRTLATQLQNNISYRTNDRAYMPSTTMSSGLMIQMPGSPPQQSYVSQSSPRQHQGYMTNSQRHCHSRHRHAPASSRRQQPNRSARKHITRSSSSDSSSPRSSPAFRARKRRTTKSSKHASPRATALGAIDFVNYTPSDSKKILTGVAPSGSSKTKARREKAAMEKRRKLSQAAVKAVKEAGGDIESLVEQGLLSELISSMESRAEKVRNDAGLYLCMP